MSQAQQSGQQDAQTILQHALGKGQSVNEPQSQGGGGPSQHSDSIALRFAKLPIEAVKRAKVTLLAGIANGWGPLQIARQLQHDLSSQLNDALRVSRTEAMNAYRDSTLEVYRANGDTVVGWRWIAAADACPACTDLNGTRHDLSEDQEAPHPNCRCGQEPILASEGLD
jgi:SPP1 gp7 family putative phage head morphogenesis protein